MSITTEPATRDLLDEIRRREQAATPGPWHWRGNIDYGDPYLTSGGHRTWQASDGREITGHAGDVLSHVAHEVTRAEARRRGVGDSDFLPEPKVSREPKETYDDRYDAAIETLREAAIDEYLTDPYGGPRKEQRLAFCTDWLLTAAQDLVTFEVAPAAASREDPHVYRADITGIRHPDAEFIARSREDVTRLLRVVEAVRDLCRDTGGDWLDGSNELPVGEFQAALALLDGGAA